MRKLMADDSCLTAEWKTALTAGPPSCQQLGPWQSQEKNNLSEKK